LHASTNRRDDGSLRGDGQCGARRAGGNKYLAKELVVLCKIRGRISAQGRVPFELGADSIGGVHGGRDEETELMAGPIYSSEVERQNIIDKHVQTNNVYIFSHR